MVTPGVHALALERAVGVGLDPARAAPGPPWAPTRSRTGRRRPGRGPVARDTGAELGHADPTDLGHPGDLRHRRPLRRRDPAPGKGLLGGRGEDEEVAPLGGHRARRPAEQAVEQAAEQHQQGGQQRQDGRRRDEAARPAAQLEPGDLHRPSPAPVVASMGSMRSTRRTATRALSTPSAKSSARPEHDGAGLEAQGDRADGLGGQRRVEGDADPDADDEDEGDLEEQGAHQGRTGRADGPQQGEGRRLLQGHDEEEQPGHQRDDQAEEQEDDRKDCWTWATPGVLATASGRVTASAPATASLTGRPARRR